MVSFCIIGHTATTAGSFPLNDLPGSGGRMDLLCRSVQASFFLSHGIREDAECTLLLMGKPKPGIIIRFSGSSIRSMSPDERSIASFIKKALSIPAGSLFREVMPGVIVKKGTLADILAEREYAVLDEEGDDIRNVSSEKLPTSYLLSDNQNFTAEEEVLIRTLPKISLGPSVVHADHAIVLLLNETDRRSSGWN